ncbi:queuosine precursor transporter [Paenibacillus sp. WQ 127069]|uniref:Probable queuosine precursor transporter n=1 Tax=Paenibacillus baimaensis TaxID=2982185 RepID=A0ABT2UPV3_9BACL|nr:queuosine precursor transporter [Paenibacillus sp. WQ 127069]MCU6796684.1 queuosine precursor transporter [Paenibacillus sp. WQ 127069]
MNKSSRTASDLSKGGAIPYLPIDGTTKKLILLMAVFISSLMIANIVAIKIVDVGFADVTAGIFFYPITFIIADTISEIWGRKVARQAIWIGLFMNACMVGAFTLVIHMPSAVFFENQAELATILGGVPRIVLASLVAYSISQNIDVYLFTRLREKTNGKHLWLRSNVATITCQLLDTSVFFVIGFIGIMPIPDMVAATGTEFGVKIMMSIVGTPIIYLLVRWVRGNSRSTTQQPQYEVTHHTQIQ